MKMPILRLWKFLLLIDTWWNVNILTAQSFGEEQLSFNRYMVECES